MFTLSNYPDIELPFYAYSRLSLVYFFVYLTVGIFLLENLLLASIVMNYKKLTDKKLEKYKEEVIEFFKELFVQIDEKKRGWISLSTLTEALGGEMIVRRDKRLTDLIWQGKLILASKIYFADFHYIMLYTDTFEQQKRQIQRVRRYIARL